jgi:hypothetical protein
MPDQLTLWIFHPTLVKFLIALVGLAVYALSKAAQRGISRRIEDASTLYNARKFVALFGYFLAIVVVATVFSDRLSGLTVALGVAGAPGSLGLRLGIHSQNAPAGGRRNLPRVRRPIGRRL